MTGSSPVFASLVPEMIVPHVDAGRIAFRLAPGSYVVSAERQ